MSTTIDQKVVEMRFDNRQFENNVSTSMSTLDKLKQSLNLTGASKGLENVGDAARNVNMSGLGAAVETVQARFSALSVMGVTALSNITNSAVNAGKKIVSALTIDPIKTGFSEYETKMGAIQTIMSNTASKGTTMQDVTRVIGELNTYADKTIYNFAEMTRNIGTFTAAGIGLEESAAAIKGIANLAAASGSSSQQASTAMYQLSQALASGTVKLMDWNSVVNAGMGGQKFQDALKETSKRMNQTAKDLQKMSKKQRKAFQETHGYTDEQIKSMMAYDFNVDKIIKKNGSFRESLQAGWITADVLNETLKNFTVDGATAYAKSMVESKKWTQEQADAFIKEAQSMEDAATKVKTFTQLWDTLKESAQSGWGQTWEIIVGDFEEAKETLTEVSDVIGSMIGASADSRNELLSGALTTGWKQLMSEGIEDAAGFEEMVTNVAKEHGVKLDEMINDETTFQDTLKEGWLTGDMLTESVEKYTDKLSKMSDGELEAAGYTKETVEKMKDLCAKFKDGSISAEEFAKKMARPSGRELLIESLWNIFKGILSVIEPVKQAFSEIFPAMQSEELYNLIERFKDFTERLKLSEEASENLKRTFKGLFAFLDVIKEAFSAIFTAIKPLFGGMTDLAGKILETTALWGDWLLGVRDAVKETKSFSVIGTKIAQIFTNIIDRVKAFASNNVFTGLFKSIGDGLKNIGSKISDTFSTIWSSLLTAFENGDVNKFMDVVVAALGSGLILKVSGFIKKFTKNLKEGFGGSAGALGEILEKLTGVLDTVRDSLKTWQTQIKAQTLMTIALAIGILALSIVTLSGIEPDKITDSLGAITMLFGELLGSLAILNKIAGKSKVSVIATLIGMAIAIRILAGALVKIAELNADQMKVGVAGIAGLAVVMIAAAKILASNKGAVMKGAIGMIGFATAIAILAAVCKDLATLSWEELAKGLAGVAGLMAAVVAFLKTAKFDGKAISTSVGIIVIAAAIKILESSCKTFASMSWEEIAKGLAGVAGLLVAVVAFTRFTGNSEKVFSTAVSLTILGASMMILVSCLKDVSQLSWDEVARGLVAIGGALAILTLTARNWPKKDIMELSISLPVITSAMKALAEALSIMGAMSWESLAKSLIALSVSMVILCKSMDFLEKVPVTAKTALTFLVAAAAIFILGEALKTIGSMDIVGAAVSIGVLAATFLIIGAAAKILAPMAPSLLKLSGSIATLGLSFVVLGVGLAAVGTGIVSLMTGFVGAIVAIQFISWENLLKGLATLGAVFAIIGVAATLLKPAATSILIFSGAILAFGLAFTAVSLSIFMLIAALRALGEVGPEAAATAVAALREVVIGFLEMLPDIFPPLFELVKTLVLGLIDVFVSCIPQLADGLLKTVLGVLEALVKYTPKIIDMIMVFIISVIDGIAARIPDLVQSVANIFIALFTGAIDVLKSVDTGTLIDGLAAVGIMAGIIIALAAVAVLTPLAMVGAVGLGLVVAELALVLAAIGKLNETPGLMDMVGSGGDLMQAIGTAIGKFIGGIIGGFGQGLSSALPQIGSDLSDFMTNAKPFIEGAKTLDPSMLDGVKSLVGIILALTAADILEGLTSWLTGGSSLTSFGEEIAAFGPSIKTYADSVKGIDAASVSGSVAAVEALAEMTNIIPNSGGVVSWFAGDNSVAAFGNELIELGKGLKGFSTSVTGIDIAGMAAAAEAAKSLTSLANTVPDSGGVVSWFAGDNSVAAFGTELIQLGKGLKGFSNEVEGVEPENITAAAEAAKSLTSLADTVPNSGGVGSWFAGDNSVAAFGTELIQLGKGLKGFSDEVEGVVPENITAAAEAAKSLTNLASTVPDSGGVVSWFAGDNSVAAFGNELVDLGKGIKGFSDEVEGIVPENVTAAATAAKSLTELANTVPDSGGVGSWFAGDNSIATFGAELVELGKGLKGFSDEVEGVVPENIVSAAAAAKSIADMSNSVPNSGGVGSWFTGEKSISKFSEDLKSLGTGLKGFSTETADIVPENVTAAANAAKTLAEMTNSIPNSGGIETWFVGEKSVSKFSADLKSLGTGLKDFSTETAEVVPENVTAAANAAKTLAEMTTFIPTEGGVESWFTGERSISKFGTDLKSLGTGLKDFSTETADIVPENVTAAAAAAKTLAEMTATIPTEGGVESWFVGERSVSKFSDDLVSLGKGLKGFSDEVTDISPENVKAASSAAKTLAEMTATIPTEGGVESWFVGETSISSFGDELVSLGKGLKGFSDEVVDIKPESMTAASQAAKNLAEMISVIPPEGGIAAWFGGEKSISKFGDDLVDLGKGLKGFSDEVVDISPENTKAASQAGKNLAEMANTVPDMMKLGTFSMFAMELPGIGTYLKGFSNNVADVNSTTVNSAIASFNALINMAKNAADADFSNLGSLGGALQKLGNTSIDKFVETFTGAKNRVTEAAKTMIDKLIEGIESKAETVKSALESIVSGALNGKANWYLSFYNTGSYLVAGFAHGISLNSYIASAAARTMASKAAEAAKNELDEHSPSKVGIEIGDYFGIGFVNGIRDNIKTAGRAGSDMAASAKNGLSNAINKIRNVIDSDMDMTPTIRPVLDLSDVRAGAGSIGDMISAGSSVGVLANVGGISAMMNQRSQNGTNAEVVSAINRLRKDLGNVGNTTYSINGVTYDDGSNIRGAVQEIVRAARIERRV